MKLFKKTQLNKHEDAYKKKAFSLIEVIVSVSIFTVMMLSMTGIFTMVMEAQRKAIASQNVQESLKYFLEVINKEIRMAQRSTGDCFVPSGDIYSVSSSGGSSVLSFKNRYGKCVRYFVENGSGSNPSRFIVSRDSTEDYISPGKISVDSVDFKLSQGTNLQELVTINIKARAINAPASETEMVLQTSLSSRYYKD